MTGVNTSAEQVQTAQAPSGALAPDFRRVFESEFGYVCRALRRLGVREADLQDVAQELFVTVHTQLPRYDRDRPIRPWLFSFALRYAANYRRLARNQGHVSEAHAPLARSDDPNVEARELVLRGLALLDFDRRTVLVMHDLEGFDAPEIASQLGIPLNTVYSRLRVARTELRAALDSLESDGGQA
jgi:RNA polymerase sigma-70 factor (ECF subfamily)